MAGNDETLKLKVETDTKAAERDLKALQKTADKLEDDPTKLKVEADTTDAQRDVTAMIAKIDALGTTKAAAVLLTSNVADVTLDMARLIAELDELDANDPQIAIKVDQIAKAEGDLDALTAKAKQLDEGLGNVRNSADQSGSVLANMAGNTAQDMGQIAGITGTAGMAIGQLTEYATEGNIALSELAAVAGPMLGLAAATILVQEAMAEQAKRSKIAADNVEGWADAIEAGGDAVQNLTGAQRDLNAELKSTGDFSAGAFLPFLESTEKLNDDLAAAGLTVEQFNQMSADGDVAIGKWAHAQLEAGNSLANVNVIVDAARDSHEALSKAEAASAASAEVFALSQEQVNAAVDAFLDRKDPVAAFPEEFQRIADALVGGTQPAVADLDTVMQGLNITLDDAIGIADNYASSTEDAGKAAELLADGLAMVPPSAQDAADAVEHLADVYGKAEEAAGKLYDQQRSAVDSQYRAEKAADDLVDTIVNYKDAVKDAHGDTRKLKQIQDDTRDSAIKFAEAQQQAAEDTAGARGEYLTAEQSNKITRDALIATTAYMDGPQKQAVLDHIARLDAIPATKTTDVNANLDPEAVAGVNAGLNALTHDRTATINVVLAGVASGIAAANAALRNAGLVVTGTSAVAPTAPVATPLGPTQQAVAVAPVRAGGTVTNNITLNTRATAGRELTRELNRWARLNGRSRG